MTRTRSITVLLALAMIGCGPAPEPEPEPEPGEPGCNLHIELCDRPLDEVAFLRTHNSMSSEERGYHIWARNHTYAVPTQLADGVRALNIDVYYEAGELIVYHGYRDLGEQPFDEILTEISDFLAANPREVLMLDFQQGAPMDVTVEALQAHALAAYFHAQPVGAPWPTLQEMIDDGGRLVVFSNGTADTPGWMHELSDYSYRDVTQAETPDDLGCDVSPEPFEHGLLDLNNVLTDPIASPDLAELVNHNPFMVDRLLECQELLGHIPNRIAVDYYSIGDTLLTVDLLNGVAADDEM